MCLLMTTLVIFMVWQASWIFDFFNDFLFSKDSAWSSGSEKPIESFHPVGLALENNSKVKKNVEV